ncbi:MAG: hypothetical protein R3D00_20620 [Bacteroidia bacterium]
MPIINLLIFLQHPKYFIGQYHLSAFFLFRGGVNIGFLATPETGNAGHDTDTFRRKLFGDRLTTLIPGQKVLSLP